MAMHGSSGESLCCCHCPHLASPDVGEAEFQQSHAGTVLTRAGGQRDTEGSCAPVVGRLLASSCDLGRVCGRQHHSDRCSPGWDHELKHTERRLQAHRAGVERCLGQSILGQSILGKHLGRCMDQAEGGVQTLQRGCIKVQELRRHLMLSPSSESAS